MLENDIALCNAIIEACAAENFDSQAAADFAMRVVEEIPYIIMSARDERKLGNLIHSFEKTTVQAIKALQRFDQQKKEVRCSVKSLILTLPLIDRIADDTTLSPIIMNLEDIRSKLATLPATKFPKAERKYISFKAAEFIADKYAYQFGELPTTSRYGHGERYRASAMPATTYDKICDLINDHFKEADFEITDHVRRELKRVGKLAAQNK